MLFDRIVKRGEILKRSVASGPIRGGGGGPGPGASNLRVQTGSYTGTGNVLDVPTDFEPDLVLVWAEAVQPVAWKVQSAWHGRSQRLDAGDSTYHITRFRGQNHESIRGDGFGVLPSYSVNTRTYRFAAIRFNASSDIAKTSIIGNAVPRSVLFTDFTPDGSLIKRDSQQPAVVTLTGRVPELSTTDGGALAGAVVHIANGVQVSGANQVNQNTPPSLGEGIEFLALRNGAFITATHFIGDGLGARQLGFAANFIIVVPVTSTGPASVVASADSTRGVTGEVVDSFTLGANVTVPASYNVDGVEYRVFAFRDSGTAIDNNDQVPVPASCGIVKSQPATLTDSFSLSEDCSIEFWGTPRNSVGPRHFMPLLLAGDGADMSGSGYSAGLYGYAANPDGHGWTGSALRWIQSDYLARERVAPYNSINRYNLNSGIVQALDDAVHIVLTHAGSGLWRMYINGRLAKEYNRTITLETLITKIDGGDGVSRALYLFSSALGLPETAIDGEIYRVQAWNAALTDTQAKSLWAEIKGGAFTAPIASYAWDFRSGIPAGVTGVVAGAPRAVGDLYFPNLMPGSQASSSATVATNPDATVSVGNVVSPSSTNCRAYFRVIPGRQYELTTNIVYGPATRVIGRLSDASGANAALDVSVFDVTKGADPNLSRVDIFTPTVGRFAFHYVFLNNTTDVSTVLATTTVRRLT